MKNLELTIVLDDDTFVPMLSLIVNGKVKQMLVSVDLIRATHSLSGDVSVDDIMKMFTFNDKVTKAERKFVKRTLIDRKKEADE